MYVFSFFKMKLSALINQDLVFSVSKFVYLLGNCGIVFMIEKI